jgi:hypothetical protein
MADADAVAHVIRIVVREDFASARAMKNRA